MKRLRILRRWFKRRFGYARLVCVGLLIGLAALRVADPAPIEEFRVRTFDTFQVIDPRVKTARPVRIVNIDEKSLAKFGQWPWPRTRVADLVTNLTRLGAVVIAFDIMFAEPDRLNPGVAADTIRNLDEETRAKLRALPSNDEILADAMRQLARGARRNRTAVCRRGTRQGAAADRSCDAGRGPAAVHAAISGPAAQHAGAGSRGRRGAACSRSGPSATASCGGCR